MAPRTAKAKKAADIKVVDSEAPKKGKAKAKNTEEVEQESAEIELDGKVAPVTEKKKRGRKAVNGDKELNGTSEESVPPKKGRKKKETTPEVNGDAEVINETTEKEITNDKKPEPEQVEVDGTNEAITENGKGRKRPAKKATEPKVNTKESVKNKKNVKESDNEIEETTVKVPKGRGRKPQPKIDDEVDDQSEPTDEEVKPEPPKGRKKAAIKNTKEKSPAETVEEPADADKSDEDDKKPKRGKGRKNPPKKAPAKNKAVDNDEADKEIKLDEEEPAPKKQKVEENEKDEEKIEEPVEAKPTKGRRGRKVPEPTPETEETQEAGEPTTKRRRKPNEEKAQDKKAPPKNKNSTDYESIDFSNTSKSSQNKEWNFKICSWNVDGIRAWMNKGGLDYLKYEKPNILCLQEVKCSQEKLPEEIANVPGYHAYWLCSEQDGYAGVGIYTSKLAMSVQYGLQDEQLDNEGRIITAEYEQFYLISTYVPNAGRKLVTLPKRLQWNDAFRKYVKELDKKKPVIICGDMNVAHNEIDLTNPKTNRKNAGFTEEERSGMTDLLGDGFVDTFRHLNPDKTGAYTFWTYMMNSRAKNVGWRLDYFIVSERLLPSICDSTIREKVYGSDHCPISLFLHLTSADKPKEEN